MIIESIRLKNIKSYGAGPDGNGVTVLLQPGANRIAGRNGHGKSTLIESLGYALFLAEPQFEENFQIETYLLSHGAKEGEIDVTFSHAGETYRIERAVGRQPKRRSKIVQLPDGAICAETEKEIAVFLCALLKMPNPARLQELFAKLVGVRQGRLVWPFDSRSGDARKFFEPLLDVAVFRDCFDRLKPAWDHFDEQRQALDKKQVEVNGRVLERADSPKTLVACQQLVLKLEQTLRQALQNRDAALAHRQTLEKLETAAQNAKIEADRSEQTAAHARNLVKLAEEQVAEARQAAKMLESNASAHTSYNEASAALAALEQKRLTRDKLKRQRDDAESDRKEFSAKADAARQQAKDFAEQRAAKENERAGLAAKTESQRNELDETRIAFDQTAASAGIARKETKVAAGFVTSLPGLSASQTRAADKIARLAGEIAAWDHARLDAAIAAEADANKLRQTAADNLAKGQERLRTLQEQLKEIAGGVCPFLKEKCKQFDPAQVEANLVELSTSLVSLQKQAEHTAEAHNAARTLLEGLSATWNQIRAKQHELDDATSRYLEPLASLPPEPAVAAVRWLRAWETSLAPLPQFPPLPHRHAASMTPDIVPTPALPLSSSGGPCSAKRSPVLRHPSCGGLGKPLGREEEANRENRSTLKPEMLAVLHEHLLAWFSQVKTWWDETEKRIEERLDQFRRQETARAQKTAALQTLSSQLAGLDRELASFGGKIAARQTDAERYETSATDLARKVAGLDQELQPFASLDADLQREQQKRDAHRAGFERYLGAKKLADELEPRRGRLAARQEQQSAAAQALANARDTALKAQAAFDPEKLAAARKDHQTKHDEANRLDTTLAAERANLEREEKRFQQWQAACQDLASVLRDLDTCAAALDLTDLARRTLRDAAPAVAQHLCNRIASRAQRLFNQINPEPIELAWDAEHYSLRITPGERRFAMLSGGEQTKLALTMTLAMIEELSGLRFCVFDEPTYGVDADSRRKLADAILQAREAASLDQLLLVSHDDVFEGKIEHSVLLLKSVAGGTRVADADSAPP